MALPPLVSFLAKLGDTTPPVDFVLNTLGALSFWVVFVLALRSGWYRKPVSPFLALAASLPGLAGSLAALIPFSAALFIWAPGYSGIGHPETAVSEAMGHLWRGSGRSLILVLLLGCVSFRCQILPKT